MKTIYVDLETYSELNITKVGIDKYVRDPNFAITLLGYKMGPGASVLYHDTQEGILEALSFMADMEDTRLVIHNGNMFDRVIMEYLVRKHFDKGFKVTWDDTIERARITQEPELNLKELATKYGSFKMDEGKSLIQLFAKPVKITKKLAEKIGIEYQKDLYMRLGKDELPEEWATYVEYLKQDVEALAVVDAHLPALSAFEKRVSEITYGINRHGVRVNENLRDVLIEIRDANNAELEQTVSINTGSTKQIIEYAASYGYFLESTKADYLKSVMKDPELPAEVRVVLEVRILTNLAALKKLDVEVAAIVDGFMNGYLVYAGASASGRFSGKLLQLQNLSHDHPDEDHGETYETLAKRIMDRDIDNKTMAKVIRPTLVPKPGHMFVIMDYSNIEARVQAWIAGDEHLQHAFREGLDIYKMTATKMWDVKYEDVTPAQRKDAKTATLALGYGGGVHSLEAFGYDGDDPQGIVDTWRRANGPITKVWDFLNNKAEMMYKMSRQQIIIPLPSGRQIKFHGEDLRLDERGKVEWFVHAGSKSYWKSMYGGVYFNRLVQGFARDIMAEAMVRLDDAGYQVVNSVHDEVWVDVPADEADKAVDEVKDIMLDHGYDGLLLDAAGGVSAFGRKM